MTLQELCVYGLNSLREIMHESDSNYSRAYTRYAFAKLSPNSEELKELEKDVDYWLERSCCDKERYEDAVRLMRELGFVPY